MQDVEETSPAVSQLSTPMEQLLIQEQYVQRIRDQLRASELYSGVGILYDRFIPDTRKLERMLSQLDFNHIKLKLHLLDLEQHEVKTLFSIIAECKAYPESPPPAGSPPFVIAVFVSGVRGHSPSSLQYPHASTDVMIIDDIIEPFLPKSAPHLTHIPKLFFISSLFQGDLDLDTQPPLFPGDSDANYCIAYHLARSTDDSRMWIHFIADRLVSGESVQDVIEKSKSMFTEGYEHLHYFSCLKDKLVLRK